MDKYGVILAGGGGTRFWPLSRQNSPKQLLNLSGNDAMINETIDRLDGTIPIGNIYISTNRHQENPLKNVLPSSFNRNNIIYEPRARNTAPCILLSALLLEKRHGNVVMCVFPSDHFIGDLARFKEILKKCMDFVVGRGSLTTIGIMPSFAATGYGYIKYGERHQEGLFYKVDEFTEKPDFHTAEDYFRSENYLWNSGMFIWRTDAIIENFKRFLPRLYEKMISVYDVLDTDEQDEKLQGIFEKLQSISIDYGILERSSDVYVIRGEFGWNDVGSWDSLGMIYTPDKDGNIVRADFMGIETKNSIVYGNDRLIATIGLDNMIIVSSEDSLLICPKDKAQEVKKIVDKLKETGRNELL